MLRRLLLRLLLSLALVAATLLATARARAAEPAIVNVGIYVNQIHELNLKENYFVADLFVWFRWKGDIKPNTTWTIIDGRIESKNETSTQKMPDGTSYSAWRVVVKITKYWDVARYPLDKNVLSIAVEEDDQEESNLRYLPDVESSGIDAAHLQMPGWQIAARPLVLGSGTYKSSFGDPTLAVGKESRYARVTVNLDLARVGETYFVKVFFGVWIAAAIAFLCFFIKPTNVDPRFGLGVGAIFAAIASEYTISSALPESGIATLADRIHLVAYAAIFITLAQSTASLWLVEHGKEELSKRIDKLFAGLLPLVYAIANAVVVLRS
jgi:hypothetical protein